jgi:pyruvate kinase
VAGEPRTKIIASLGPSSSSFDVVLRLAEAGASGFRINFAHGDPGLWSSMVGSVAKAEQALGRPLTLIGDLSGASIRIGELDKPIQLKRGDRAKLILSARGSADRLEVPLPVREVYEGLEAGDVVLMDDGRVKLKVVDVAPGCVELVAFTDAVIKSRKAFVVVNKDFDLPALTEKDLADLRFALDRGFDYIGLSYVRRPSDVEALRRVIRGWGHEDVRVIAKIEAKSALENLDGIVEAADAVLVARGDLGMVMGLENIPHLQRRIVSRAIEMEKPVIIATQLLESMVESPVPTRAEVVDVNAAVAEGVDALMLTGETAVGKYPVEAVSWLRRIVRAAEENVSVARRRGPKSLRARFAEGVTSLAEDLGAKLVIYSVHGNTARLISLLRPAIDVYVGAPSPRVLKQLNILWGLKAYLVEAPSYDEGLEEAFKLLRKLDEVRLGDLVVLTCGLRGDEQLIRVKRVEG